MPQGEELVFTVPICEDRQMVWGFHAEAYLLLRSDLLCQHRTRHAGFSLDFDKCTRIRLRRELLQKLHPDGRPYTFGLCVSEALAGAVSDEVCVQGGLVERSLHCDVHTCGVYLFVAGGA